MSNVLAGGVAGLRLLADGSVRVTIDFEPKDRKAVMDLMGEPGAMIACARLKDGTGAARDPKPDPRGPLCMEAIGLANNTDFQAFAARTRAYSRDSVGASKYIKVSCRIETRKELDTNAEAAGLYRDMVSRYRRWLTEQGGASRPGPGYTGMAGY